MLPEAARAARKVQGSITFDLGIQSGKKIDFQEGGT